MHPQGSNGQGASRRDLYAPVRITQSMKHYAGRPAIALATWALLTLSGVSGAVAVGWGQAVPVVTLEGPKRLVSEPFSQIRGVRELADGRVLISDWVEERVSLFDPATTTDRLVGGPGQGPEEYRLPERLIGLPGDSTLLVDMGNSRLAVIGPDGVIHRAFSNRPAEIPYGIWPGGADAGGRLYFVIPRWARRMPPNAVDSAAPVARWDPSSGQVDTLLTVRGITPRSDAGLPRRTAGLPYVPFALRDAWRVRADGGVVVVRAEGYLVEVRDQDGTWRRGAPVPFRAQRTSAADREVFVRRFLARSPISGRGPNGGLGHTPTDQMTEAAVAETIANNEFAEWLPPFDPALVWLAPDDELWVGRWAQAGEPQVFDVFDRSGRRVHQVELTLGRQVVGVGRETVYLTNTDEDGLEYLELYSRPSR
jgi:hypothetical protein